MNKLPSNWNQVSIKQFNELREIDESTSPFMKQVLIISTLLDIEPDDKEIEDMDINDLVNMLAKCTYLLELPKNEIYNEIDNYKLIDLNKLTLGEFIDIDYFISENPLLNLNKISSILYRNYSYDKFGNIIYETYDNINLDDRSALFQSISIGHTFGLINHFLSFKTKIYGNYQSLFNPVLDEEDLDEEDLDDPEVVKEIEKEKLHAKFSWEFILYNFSKGDITKYDKILNLPLIFIMNQLSFKKSFSLD